ncbi:hypothetical protein UNDYM_0806 [Undibacterium sp. YM2]|nr:hypothetical protein UNDYM_0806 [Undibacterium sp. YM2]
MFVIKRQFDDKRQEVLDTKYREEAIKRKEAGLKKGQSEQINISADFLQSDGREVVSQASALAARFKLII